MRLGEIFDGGPGTMLFVLIAGAILLGIYGERWRAKLSWRAWAARGGGWTGRAKSVAKPADVVLFDAPEQLRCVTAARFSKRRLLNASESRVLRETDRAIADAGKPWRAMAQVSLGEILASRDEQAYRAINSKRVDILIVTATGDPLAAVEYQGKGHHQGTAAARDAIKKEALRRAGIGYIEVCAGDQPADLRRAVARLAE